MGFRKPAPDGRQEAGLPIMVLPDDTVVHGYRFTYLTCGGMSVIYKAFKDERQYIIKEVAAEDTRNVMSLIQEKAVLERLNHPGIVQVFDLFDEDGFYYMATEFISGVTVDKKLPIGTDRFISETIVRDWAYQIFDIFEYLHNQTPPIIYRDLKPKNIMIDTSGKVKLIDFGIARTYKEGRSQDTEHMGSMVTASPEHYGAQTDARSDIYTIGATLHYILTNGKTMECNAFDIPSVRLFNKQVTSQFASVIEKALELSPDARFQTVGEMRAALKGSNYLVSGVAIEQIQTQERKDDEEEEEEEEKAPKTTIIKPVSEHLKIESARESHPTKIRQTQTEPEKVFPSPSQYKQIKTYKDTPPKTDGSSSSSKFKNDLYKDINVNKDAEKENRSEPLRSLEASDGKNSERRTKVKKQKNDSSKKTAESLLTVFLGFIGGIVLAGGIILLVIHNSVPPVVNWSDAKKYDGRVIVVEGEVKEIYMTSKNNIYLYFSPGPSRANTFRIGIFSENFEKFHCTEQPEEFFKHEYLNRIVRMKGKVRIEAVANDEIPQMFATHPAEIEIIQQPPGTY